MTLDAVLTDRLSQSANSLAAVLTLITLQRIMTLQTAHYTIPSTQSCSEALCNIIIAKVTHYQAPRAQPQAAPHTRNVLNVHWHLLNLRNQSH
jgi:hypothetical protein